MRATRLRPNPLGSTKLTLQVLILLLLGIPVTSDGATLPANLLISAKDEPHHVILVEKGSRRLFVYEFAGEYSFVATFKCAAGESPGDKQVSKNEQKGDNNLWVRDTKEVRRERSTNGCIVPANGDLVEMGKYIKIWDTPIIEKEIKLAVQSPPDRENKERFIPLFVEEWRHAWREGPLAKYLACYHAKFETGNMDLRGWRPYKEQLFQRLQDRPCS